MLQRTERSNRWQKHKKHIGGEHENVPPLTLKKQYIKFKREVAKVFGWSLYEINETEYDSLLDFVGLDVALADEDKSVDEEMIPDYD